MEDVLNVSSEEELQNLRDEGKISEAEYEELRDAMQTPKEADVKPPAVEIDKAKHKRKLGKIAFVLMLVGIILPALCFMLVNMAAQAHGANAGAKISPWFFLGVALEIAAFVIGVIAWPDVFGKATVISISAIVVLALLFALLTVA